MVVDVTLLVQQKCVHTATSHADTKTLLISTTLAVCARRQRHLTMPDVFAFKLVTVTSVAQEERLQATHAVVTENNQLCQCARNTSAQFKRITNMWRVVHLAT